jgi:hypothetical protein
MNRNDLVAYIRTLTPEHDSNLKFMNLMKSRLLELGIFPDDALEIVSCMSFDFSNVPEDDDTLSDIATEYADYCKKAYDKLCLHGLVNKKLFNRVFNRVFLKVDH